MTITKLFPSGGFEVSDVVGDGRISRVYFGFTRSECVAMFKAEINNLVGAGVIRG